MVTSVASVHGGDDAVGAGHGGQESKKQTKQINDAGDGNS